jgi:hypothetical protein
MPAWAAIVVLGAPTMTYRKVWTLDELPEALRVASRLRGSGSCTEVRIVCCETRAAARKADISDCKMEVVR